MNTQRSIATVGVITGMLTVVAAVGFKKIHAYVKGIQKESTQWQELYYDHLTKDDIAWG